MSYFLAGKDGYAGDFANIKGLADMRKHFPKLRALQKFLKHGQADEKLRQELVKELEKVPELRYAARLFHKAKAPVILTDGVVEDDGSES